MADYAAKRETVGAGTDELSQNVKRAKVDNENGGGENGKESENILCGFKTSTVLSDSAREKIMFVHGKVRLLQS